MSTTRSGTIYNTRASVERRSPRLNKCTVSFDPVVYERPKRSTNNRIPLDILREYLNTEDYDSSSDYDSEDEVEEQAPKYDVNIDFDEASTAWRSNKQRIGQVWLYKLNPKHPDNIESATTACENSIASRVKAHRRGKK